MASGIFILRRAVLNASDVTVGAVISTSIGLPFFMLVLVALGQVKSVASLPWQSYAWLSAAGIIHFVIGRSLSYRCVQLYIPVPPLMELIKVKTVYGVPFPHEVYLKAWKIASDKLGCDLAYSPGVILAGTLPTQTEDMECFSGSVLGYFCHEDADEELIYQITKTLAAHYYRLGELFSSLDKVTPHVMVQLMYIGHDPGVKIEDETHPGALRYYKEVGLWPRAWHKRVEIGLK